VSDAVDPVARDAAARKASQEEFVRPLLLEAGAGTGKTLALVARVTLWCLGTGWTRAREELGAAPGGARQASEIAARVARGVVAITFTEAAAAEMARRLGEMLASFAAGDEAEDFADVFRVALPEPEDDRRARAAALLAVLDRMPVSTIHAFCQRLLSRHPLEAGLHPAFGIDADGTLTEGVVREVVEARLAEAYGDPPHPDFLALAEHSIGPAELCLALEQLVASGVEPGELAEPCFTPERIAEACAELRNLAQALIDVAGERLLALPTNALGRKAVEAAMATAAAADAIAASEAGGFDRLRKAVEQEWTQSICGRLRLFAAGRFDTSKQELNALAGVEAETAAASAALHSARKAFGELDPDLFEAARRALRPLLAELRDRLRRRGVMTFDALLRDAAHLLRTHPDVATRERRELRQLLVDEFQDTDRVQCEIVRQLAFAGPASERPGLFLVGDPKQSIYGWRNADLRAYQALRAELEAANGVVLPLAANFRSAPPLLDEVQRLLGPVLCDRPGVQAAFQPLVPSPRTQGRTGFSADGRAPVEHWVPCAFADDGTARVPNASEAAAIEARAIARDLRALHAAGHLEWRHAALLLRSATDVDVYLEAFRREGVPYEVAKDRSFYRRREVIEAAALLRSVVDPHDHLALLGWLRSVAVGVPDAAWIPLWTRHFPALVGSLQRPDAAALPALRAIVAEAAAALGDDVPGLERVSGWSGALVAALEALAVLRAAFREDAPDLFVEKLRTLGGGEALEAGRHLGRYRAANLDRFYRELAERLAEGGDPLALLRRLRRDVGEAREVARGAAQSATDAVQVMSIHAAKGLQYAHVYLAQLHKGRPRPRQDTGSERGEHAGGTALRLVGAPGIGWRHVESAREEREDAELERLLYVATTRAEHRLVLSGLLAIRQGGAGGETAAEKLAGRRQDEEATAGLAAAAASGGRHIGASGVAWVYPELVALPKREPGMDARGQAPDARAIAEESATLAAARVLARARMARRLTAPASAQHETARELFEQDEAREADASEPAVVFAPDAADASAHAARAVGTAVHRALEGMDFAAEPGAELVRCEPALRSALGALLPVDEVESALVAARAVLTRVVENGLHAELRARAPRILARELPVLIAGRVDGGPEDPIGAFTGVIDLLYRDAKSGDLVVADYKTDDVTGAAVAERARSYAEQGRIYVEALRRALGLARPPRFELWFLRAGRIETVPTPRSAG
jgi:ATP-dependent helicase/nuclease subunit A